MSHHNPGRRRLAVATYNIHGGAAAREEEHLDRVGAVIRELGAEVVGLQEVLGHDALARLAATTGLQAVAGLTLLRGGRHYGNAVLTALPVRRVSRLDLSVPRREPRGALDLQLAAGDSELRLLVTHFGLRPGERRQQARRLLRHLEAGPATATTVLMGDLNEWLLWGRPLRWLSRWFSRAPAPATFPARLPLLALDRIWVRPQPRLVRVARHRSPLARTASDHLPLTAVVEV